MSPIFKPRHRHLVLAALLSVPVLVAAQTAGIYTCVDAKGRKLTSDRPIVDCLDREQLELNPSGTVRRKVGPSLTAQERAAEEEKQRQLAEERARAVEEKRRDHALLIRYPYRSVHDAERREALAQIDVVIKAAQNRLVELQQQQPALQENDLQRRQQLQNLSESQQQLTDKQTQLEKQLLKLESRRPNDWLLAEADYLVRMAGRKLWLERDATAAQMLLIEADNRLRDLNDASLLPLRQALTSDLAKLKELPTLDREGMVLRIGALIDNVDQLTLLGINPPPRNEEDAATELSDELGDWRSNLRKSWSAFSENFITIRRRNGNTEALISPQQTWYLKENLKTRLLQAQLAVYREQQAVYEDNLTKADKWLEQYFDPNDTVSQYMHSEIAKLLEQPVVLEYPKQFASQHQLEELVHQRLQHLMAQ